jgi:hypothetical protein
VEDASFRFGNWIAYAANEIAELLTMGRDDEVPSAPQG